MAGSPAIDLQHMARALRLAAMGQGAVEPNPMVGCVVAHGDRVVGEGWHRQFGGAHAEREALAVAGSEARGATLYVTLEPCCHHGKTPPCTDAILAAGVARVVVALDDCFPQVAGRGISQLQQAGIPVEVGLMREAAAELTAPYRKLVQRQRPWIIAKWAMTLDGKMATKTGDSQWISGTAARQVVHQLRGRVDAIMVGSATALRDDPLLTARPPGKRIASRVIIDSQATLPLASQLVATARSIPVLVAVGPSSDSQRCTSLEANGCQLIRCQGQDHGTRLDEVLSELGRRRMTNVLVEGGGRLLGNLFALDEIDEVHVFVAPLLIGGTDATVPVGGVGLTRVRDAARIVRPLIQTLDHDVYISGPLARQSAQPGQ